MKIKIFFLVVLAVVLTGAYGQRYFNNPVAQYYRNGFLWNPAYAGETEHTRLYALYKKGWTGFDGAPQLVDISGDIHFGGNSGIGLQLFSEKSGVLQRDFGAIAYSYRVKLSEKDILRLGMDLSLFKERLDNEVVTQNGQVDPTAKSFNQRPWDFDGDVGATYTHEQLTLGVAGYNLRTALWAISNDPADLSIAQFQGSYRFILASNNALSLTPLASYKLFFRHQDVATFATQFEYDHVFHVSVYYQSTGNFMGGVGVQWKDKGEVNFFYSGNNKYSYNQQYEIGLKVLIGKK